MVAALPPPALSVPTHAATAAPGSVASAPHGWTTYTVRDGDTLTSIAARHRTTVSALVARNHLRDPHLIRSGSRLSVPRTSAASPAAAPTPPATVHVVRAGETLTGIAARYRVPLASVLKANHLTIHSVIHVGDRVTVRGARAGGPAKAAASPTRRGTVPTTFNGVTYPSAVARAAARNRATLARRDVPSRVQVKALVARTARRHGVDPALALAVAFQESGWNQRAVSPANAIGVMQVIPAGGDWASTLVGRRLDLLDTEDNVTAGVVMLRALGRATPDREATVAAYYQGLASLNQRGMFADTRQYVRTVLALRARM
jgi:LysM repeat protein